jgi:hypothetical protein
LERFAFEYYGNLSKTRYPGILTTMSGIVRMVTRGSAARGTPAFESTARETGEPTVQHIEQEASTAGSMKESEVTQADLQDLIAEQRKFTQVVLEKLAASEARQAAMDAQLDRAESRAPRPFPSLTEYSVAQSPPPEPPIPAAIFRMRDPAKFCGGAGELERFLTQLELVFELHGRHFPRGDPDKVQYATGLLASHGHLMDHVAGIWPAANATVSVMALKALSVPASLNRTQSQSLAYAKVSVIP